MRSSRFLVHGGGHASRFRNLILIALSFAVCCVPVQAQPQPREPYKTVCEIEDEEALAEAAKINEAHLRRGFVVPPGRIASSREHLRGVALKPRKPHTKLKDFNFNKDVHAGIIDVKFVEGSEITLKNGVLVSGNKKFKLDHINDTIAKHGMTVRPLFDDPLENLRADKTCGERRLGEEMPDLTTWFAVEMPAIDIKSDNIHGQLNSVIERLSNFAEIETLSFRQTGIPAPRSDITPPVSVSCDHMQTYLDPATGATPGVDARFAWTIPGGKGLGIKFIDIERAWDTTHEDLNSPTVTSYAPTQFWPNAENECHPVTGVCVDRRPGEIGHGTLVLGVVVGDAGNNFGTKGIAPEASFGVHSLMYPPLYYDNHALAVKDALLKLSPGDVMLMEFQVTGPSGAWSCSDDANCRYVFGEHLNPVFDALKTYGLARDVTVIETAGNGNVDLGHSSFLGYNDKNSASFRDSGAIVVGAREPSGAPSSFSTYGARADVSAWGSGIYTTAYNAAFGPLACGYVLNPPIPQQSYWDGFGGTSSAGAVIAGVATSLQGIQKARGGQPIKPRVLRQLFRDIGTAQQSSPKNIGKMPNMKELYLLMISDEDGDGMAYIDELIAGRNPTVDERRALLLLLDE